MPRPICFMIMPYSTKPTSASQGSGAPDKVNFDRLWEAALRPAIDQAGYEPVRANEDIGALIITEMIERLAISDLVLADVSIPNGNVYYEVGIRHAAQKQGCIMTAATWSKPLFDIDQMRRIRYPLPTESISDDVAAEIKRIVAAAIPVMSAGDSPFYQVFPKYPEFDPVRATSFKKSVEELSRFQAEIIAARTATGQDRRTRALDLRARYYTGGPVQKAVAIELLYTLRDSTDWTTTLEFIDTLPGDLRNSPLVKEQRALALSKSGDHDTAIGALRELISSSGDTSERRGLLGGRYKKKWNTTHNPADLDRAIAEYETGMKLDLNDYYPSSNLARLYRTRKRKGDDDKARISAAVTVIACERARLRKTDDEWLNPTLLGAAFDAGDVDKAQELADQVAMDGYGAWKLETTLDDCRTAAGLYEDPRRSELLAIVGQLEALLPPKPAAK
ncbi:MAG: TRAFs-binding domain-containing protein [Acidobacteriia bacterium]|nr:TRAFs-binding domain-containing protein [Terriglobia bacterium]